MLLGNSFKFRIALDPIFPPPNRGKFLVKSDSIPDNIYDNNNFELIFNEIFDR